jgi:parallel beta-helix repeat protein
VKGLEWIDITYSNGSQAGRITALIAIIVVISGAIAFSIGYFTFLNPITPEMPTIPTTTLPEIPTITLPNATEIHSPLFIDGDDELVSIALQEEWPGEGTPSSPYVIQGLEISSNETCIYIINIVEIHVVIRNCIFYSTNEWYGAGVEIWETSNVRVETCIFYGSGWGVNFVMSQNCGISNSIIQGTEFGVNVSFSEFIHVRNVIVCNNTAGMLIDNSVEVVIRDNQVFRNEYSIDLWYVSNSVLKNNNVTNNQNGILIAGPGSNVTVLENTMTDNTGNGLELGEYASFIHVVGNRFGWNLDYNAVDNGTNNMWDDGVRIGNAWSDYNGDGGYVLPGSAESIDHYPSLYER